MPINLGQLVLQAAAYSSILSNHMLPKNMLTFMLLGLLQKRCSDIPLFQVSLHNLLASNY